MKNVVIFGAPRSGTTWLGQLFNSSPNTLYRFQPLFSYEFKNYLNSESSESEINNFHSKLIKAKSNFVKTNLNFPKKEITHLVWKEVRYHHITENLLKNSDIKIIYIKRNPIDVINSWYNAPKEFDKSWNIQDEWRYAPSKNLDKLEEFNGFEKWVEANKIHENNAKKYPNRVFFIDFDELKLNTESTMMNAFNFIGLDMDNQTKDFIFQSKSVHSDDAYSIYKTKNTNINLPKSIIDKINEIWIR